MSSVRALKKCDAATRLAPGTHNPRQGLCGEASGENW